MAKGNKGKAKKAAVQAAEPQSNGKKYTPPDVVPQTEVKEAAASKVDIDADPVGFLVAPESAETFFTKTWEKKPVLYKATAAKKAAIEGVLSVDSFCSTLDAQEEKGCLLAFGMDVNAVKYVDEKRVVMNGDEQDIIDRSAAKELLKDGCTLQVHHPQRYDDKAWRLCAALEQQLGCLVGCNAYLTPAGSQGLAPHYDDVELWVCQTEGSKRWKVYEPLLGMALPTVSSPDLPRAVIGDPVMEVTLEVGDVLYLPRGTIHEAAAQETDSSHLTLSTYQKWTWQQLTEHVMAASELDMSMPLSMRSGLPTGFVYQNGIQNALAPPQVDGQLHMPDETITASKQLAQRLRDLAAAVEENPQLVLDAADKMATEFTKCRLPPFPQAMIPKGDVPDADSMICCRVPGLARLVEMDPNDSDDESDDGGDCADETPSKAELKKENGDKAMDDDEDEDDEEDVEPNFRYKLFTSIHNMRETHMIDMGEDDFTDSDEDGGVEPGDGDDDDDDEPPPELVKMLEKASEAREAKASKKLAEVKPSGDEEDDSEDGIEDLDLEDDPEDLAGTGIAVPDGHAHAVATILSLTGGNSIKVRDLKLLGDEGTNADETKVLLVRALHALGVVRTLEAVKVVAKSKKRTAEDEAPASSKKAKSSNGKKGGKNK